MRKANRPLKVPKLIEQDWAKKKLKAYMACSRAEGPVEGAILVIAHTWREARDMAWESGECFNVEDWLDQAVYVLRDPTRGLALADQEKLRMRIPHIVTQPAHCESCDAWGMGLDSDGACGNCGENPGGKLVELIRGYNDD